MLALTAYAVIATLALLFACATLAHNSGTIGDLRRTRADLERRVEAARATVDKLHRELASEITHSEKLRIDLINAQKNDHRDARGRFARPDPK